MIMKKLISVLASVAIVMGMLCFGSVTATAAANLITGGKWVAGQYLPNSGAFETTGQKESSYRIAYNQKISVTPGETYKFDVGSSSETLKLIIRGYDSSGAFSAVSPATIVSGEITMPYNVVQVSISVYDTRLSSGGSPTSAELLGLVSDGSLMPVVKPSAESNELTIDMADGASMRIDGTTEGIRFTAVIDKTAFDEKLSDGTVTEIGTLIAKSGTAIENVIVDNAVEVTDSNTKIADGKIPVAKYAHGTTMQADESADKYVIVGSLVEIKEENANQKYVARAYVKYVIDNAEYVMYASALSDARSIAEVANNIKNAGDNYYDSLCDNHKTIVDLWANKYIA